LTGTGEVVRASVRFEWLEGGSIVLDSTGKLAFPGLPAQPGIYRFTLTDTDGLLVGVYIGESDNLARRMSNYRIAGPTQPTNQRLNVRFRELLASEGNVVVALSTSVTVDDVPIDLAAKPARLLAESAALISVSRAGQPIENLRTHAGSARRE
jgi:hypothetical protein